MGGWPSSRVAVKAEELEAPPCCTAVWSSGLLFLALLPDTDTLPGGPDDAITGAVPHRARGLLAAVLSAAVGRQRPFAGAESP